MKSISVFTNNKSRKCNYFETSWYSNF